MRIKDVLEKYFKSRTNRKFLSDENIFELIEVIHNNPCEDLSECIPLCKKLYDWACDNRTRLSKENHGILTNLYYTSLQHENDKKVIWKPAEQQLGLHINLDIIPSSYDSSKISIIEKTKYTTNNWENRQDFLNFLSSCVHAGYVPAIAYAAELLAHSSLGEGGRPNPELAQQLAHIAEARGYRQHTNITMSCEDLSAQIDKTATAMLKDSQGRSK